jgi:hypothetical protein
VLPVGLLTMVTQQQIQQQRRPEVLANGVFAVSEEVGDAQGLFDLLEEHFDAPAAFVECAHAAGGPRGVVRNEDHGGFLDVEFDEHFHPPEGVGIQVAAFRRFKENEIVAQGLPGGLFEKPFLTVWAMFSFARVTQ